MGLLTNCPAGQLLTPISHVRARVYPAYSLLCLHVSESVVPLSGSVICRFFACGAGVVNHSVTSRAVSVGSSRVLDVMREAA